VSIATVNDVKFKDRFNKEKLDRVLQAEALSTSLREVLLKQFRSE